MMRRDQRGTQMLCRPIRIVVGLFLAPQEGVSLSTVSSGTSTTSSTSGPIDWWMGHLLRLLLLPQLLPLLLQQQEFLPVFSMFTISLADDNLRIITNFRDFWRFLRIFRDFFKIILKILEDFLGFLMIFGDFCVFFGTFSRKSWSFLRIFLDCKVIFGIFDDFLTIFWDF